MQYARLELNAAAAAKSTDTAAVTDCYHGRNMSTATMPATLHRSDDEAPQQHNVLLPQIKVGVIQLEDWHAWSPYLCATPALVGPGHQPAPSPFCPEYPSRL